MVYDQQVFPRTLASCGMGDAIWAHRQTQSPARHAVRAWNMLRENDGQSRTLSARVDESRGRELPTQVKDRTAVASPTRPVLCCSAHSWRRTRSPVDQLGK